MHFSGPDIAGHRHGFGSPEYRDAVQRVSRRIATIRSWVTTDDRRGPQATLFIVTTDHGGAGRRHDNPVLRTSYQIPFIAWGSMTASGEDIYDEAPPSYRDPDNRCTQDGQMRQPVRNGDLANLVTDVLGLPPVRGSEIGRPPLNLG